MTNAMTLAEAARYIAGVLDWPVLPTWWLTEDGHCACPEPESCDSPGKHPRIAHGLTDATTDPATVSTWWARWPHAGIGVRCDHLLVVDIDNPGGWDNWLEIAEPHGWQVDDTLVCVTRGNGVHVYYWLPDGILDGSGASGGIATKVDSRYHNNYVIAPPTPGYDVINDAEPALAPAWLTGHIAEVKKPQAPAPDTRMSGAAGTRYGLQALESELGRLVLAPEGTRNDSLNRAALRCGQLVAGGQLDPVHAAQQLHAVAVRIGLGDKETAATIRSGMTAGARQPRSPAA
jgi:Bifunctional DNA primase/polymerase, N-terminal